MDNKSTYKPWTEEEISLLREKAATTPPKVLSAELGRPVRMVRWKAHKLELPLYDGRKDGSGVTRSLWTEEALAYLKEHAANVPARDLAATLERTEKQVRQALSHYGIAGRGVKGRVQDEAEREARGAGRRGVRSYQAGDVIACSACGKETPVYLDVQGRVQSLWCMRCTALKRYGVGSAQFDARLAEQGGKCKICPSTNEGKQWHVDHDHGCCNFSGSCGKCVRGILCASCNLNLHAIERFLNEPEYAAAVLAYLA